ncbi:MAG: hypothetical protein QME51_10475 [Planctomycetota bacterium]|nr:hypothetical protein [Planctomycetota bacterium]
MKKTVNVLWLSVKSEAGKVVWAKKMKGHLVVWTVSSIKNGKRETNTWYWLNGIVKKLTKKDL